MKAIVGINIDIGTVNYENKDISKLYTNILSNGKIIESIGERFNRKSICS